MRNWLVFCLFAALFLVAGCTETYTEYCIRDDVVGVYTCEDELLKVDYSDIGKGFEIVKSDDTVVQCPVVAPSAMSDDCRAALEQDYCQSENLCTGVISTTTPTKGEFELLISDEKADIDDFDSLIVELSKTRIFKSSDNETAFTEADVNHSVDLTQVVGENAISVLKIELEEGTYTKIELLVADVNGIVNGTVVEVKIPSDNLKLVRQFEIKAGEVTKFVFDINVVKNGNQDAYNLLPVIGKSGLVGEDVDINETECTMDEDCGLNELCFDGECMGLECVTDDDCSENETCMDNECIELECLIDEDCNVNQTCVNNTCIMPECINDVDCNETEICLDNACLEVDCVTDNDCGVNETCVNNSCVGPECIDDLDCTDYNCTIAFPTPKCRDNACLCIAECVNVTDCEPLGNYTCIGNECVLNEV